MRFDVLDFYRYAGALFIALDHYLIVYLPVDRNIIAHIHLQLQPLMGFFFTLSGFVIMHVYQRMSSRFDYIDYLQKRLARMYPLHLATFAFFLICPMFGILRYWYSSDAILPNLLLIHAWGVTSRLTFNYPSWSVSAEIFVYLLFPVFLSVIRRLGLWSALLIPCLCAVLNTILFDTFGLGSWTSASFDFGCLRAVPSFIAGMAVYRLATEKFSGLIVPAWAAHGLAIATIPMMIAGAPNEFRSCVICSCCIFSSSCRTEHPWTSFYSLFPGALELLLRFLYATRVGRSYHPRPSSEDFSLRWGCLEVYSCFGSPRGHNGIGRSFIRFFEDPARRFFGNFRFGEASVDQFFARKKQQ